MLSIESLTVDYGSGPVLDQLGLTLEPGAVHGLVGRNGEGKTTLLNAIYGTIGANSGQVNWDGRPIRTQDIAYLQTELYFYPMITGEEYLRIFQAENQAFDIAGWNEMFDLPLKDFISTYSTGMKKKLALMSVLSFERPVVMLDEAFNGLDLESNILLGRIIRMVADRGKTVIVTSHILESLMPLCDKIHLLENGKIGRTYTSADVEELKAGLIATLEVEKIPGLVRLLG